MIQMTVYNFVINSAPPSIASDFEISLTTGQWITSAYSLVLAIMMPLTAFLITRFPTKCLYMGLSH